MSSCVKGTKQLSFAALAFVGSLVQELDAKICLIHETVVQHRKKILGRVYGANLTIVRIHNCPIYTRCCETSRGCCFDYPWFWSSLGVVLFVLFLAAAVSTYYWYKRKRDGTAVRDNVISITAPAALPEAGLPQPMTMLPGPRSGGFVRSGGPKPPAYAEVPPSVSPQPGSACPRRFGEAPPPYSLQEVGAGDKPFHTRTTTV